MPVGDGLPDVPAAWCTKRDRLGESAPKQDEDSPNFHQGKTLRDVEDAVPYGETKGYA